MSEQKKKPGAGIAVLGFFLTFLLTISMLAEGLLLGLKTTIFSGNDMVDVLKNANLFETFTEVIVTEITVNAGEGMVSDMAESIITEDALVEMTENVTEAIKNDEDVDLSGMKDACIEEIKSTSDGMVEQVLGELEAGGGEINAETLADNATIQSLQEQYGIDISGIVLEYVEETYGTTSINVEEVDMEAVKAEAQTTMEEVVMPEVEKMVDEYIVEINRVVNEEIRTITKEYDISGMLGKIEAAIALLSKSVLVLGIAVGVIVLVELLIYLKFLNRAFRNIGIASVISGAFNALSGGTVIVLKSVLMGMLGGTGDKAEQVIVGFIDSNVSAIGYRILLIGGIYIVVAIVTFVVAGILKKRKG